ncbi:MAG: hypothetical protein ACMXYG_04475 [Candidatus Woesearchaeota archaeon]
MIRFPEIYDHFKNRLNENVVLTDSGSNILPPLDKILPVLEDLNNDIDIMQNVNSSCSLEDLVLYDKRLRTGDKAVRLLLDSSFNFPPYLHVSAKITDAGDKLDNEIITRILDTSKEFDVKYHELLSKYTPATNLGEIRVKLNTLCDDFFTYENLFSCRGLPSDELQTYRNKFFRYNDSLKQIKEIEIKIVAFEQKYRSLPLEDLPKFQDYAKKQIASGVFRKGELLRRCIDNDYVEGIIKLKSLEEEINYAIVNKRKITKVVKTIDTVKKDYEQLKEEIGRVGIDVRNTDKLREVYEKSNIQLSKLHNENIERLFDEKVYALKNDITDFMRECLVSVDKKLQELSDDPGEYELIAELYKRFEGVLDIEDRISKIDRKLDELYKKLESNFQQEMERQNEQVAYLGSCLISPDSKNNILFPSKESRFYKIVDAIEGNGFVSGWSQRLDYIDWFIAKEISSNSYASTPEDLDTLSFAYQKLDEVWKNNKIGVENMPCKEERLKISDTVNNLHNYLQSCKVYYGLEVV